MSSMFGFLFVDKPEGGTSFSVVRQLRRLTGERRIGFLGTLDPLATGLLVFALGEATKLIPYLEGLDKVYEVTIRLGSVSNTYDATGEVQESFVDEKNRPSRSQIEKILEEDFLGERMQVPPQFSAIKIEGKRAYALARKNVKVEMKPRKVSFYDLKVKSYTWPLLRVNVHCSSGTYVRSFAHHLGQKLGCGGLVQALRRTKVGSFSIKGAAVLDSLTPLNVRSHLIAPEDLLAYWPRLDLSDQECKVLDQGGFIGNKGGFQKGPILAFHEGRCVGVLEVRKSGELKFERKFNRV